MSFTCPIGLVPSWNTSHPHLASLQAQLLGLWGHRGQSWRKALSVQVPATASHWAGLGRQALWVKSTAGRPEGHLPTACVALCLRLQSPSQWAAGRLHPVELPSTRPAPAEGAAHRALQREVIFPGLFKIAQLLRALQDSPRQSLSSTHCLLWLCPPVAHQEVLMMTDDSAVVASGSELGSDLSPSLTCCAPRASQCPLNGSLLVVKQSGHSDR